MDSLNFAMWGYQPATLADYDIARSNLTNLLGLTLTGMTNAIYAQKQGTISLATTRYTTDQLRVAYETKPTPGRLNPLWHACNALAIMAKGGSKYGSVAQYGASSRVEGRPSPILSGAFSKAGSEFAALEVPEPD